MLKVPIRLRNVAVRTVLVAVLTALGAAGLLVATTAPAQADYEGPYISLDNPFDIFPSEPGWCETGYFCAWRGTTGSGGGVGFYYDKWDWGASDVPVSINNTSESWWNHGFAGSFDDVQMYTGAGGTGSSYCVRNGVQLWSGSAGGLKNAASAHVWRNSC